MTLLWCVTFRPTRLALFFIENAIICFNLSVYICPILAWSINSVARLCTLVQHWGFSFFTQALKPLFGSHFAAHEPILGSLWYLCIPEFYLSLPHLVTDSKWCWLATISAVKYIQLQHLPFSIFYQAKEATNTRTHTTPVWVAGAIATLTKQIEAIASFKESFLLHLNVLLILQSSDIRLLYWNFQFFTIIFYLTKSFSLI